VSRSLLCAVESVRHFAALAEPLELPAEKKCDSQLLLRLCAPKLQILAIPASVVPVFAIITKGGARPMLAHSCFSGTQW
jgi:hypothetical protein